MMRPLWLGTSRITALPSVDFPQPDSPTRPTVSPAATSRLTSSTACTTPRDVGKLTQRLSTDRSDIAQHLLFAGEARCQPVRQRLRKGRSLLQAGIECKRAAARIGAAGGQIGKARHVPGNV